MIQRLLDRSMLKQTRASMDGSLNGASAPGKTRWRSRSQRQEETGMGRSAYYCLSLSRLTNPSIGALRLSFRDAGLLVGLVTLTGTGGVGLLGGDNMKP